MPTPPAASQPPNSSDLSHSALFLQNPDAPLSALQLRVAAALARGLSVTSAAAETGVHRTTVHHWLRTSEPFAAALRAARAEASARCRAELHALVALSLKTLRSLLESPSTPPAVRLRAALASLKGDLLPNPAFIDDWPLPNPAASDPAFADPAVPDPAFPGPPSPAIAAPPPPPQPAASTPLPQRPVPAPVPPQRTIDAAERAALLATLRADRERLGLLPPGSPAVAPLGRGSSQSGGGRANQGAPSAAPPPAVAPGAKEGFSGPSTNSGDTPYTEPLG